MGIRDTIRNKLYDWGERLDVAAGAPPRLTNHDLAQQELGRLMLSPDVVETLDTNITFHRMIGDLVIDDPIETEE